MSRTKHTRRASLSSGIAAAALTPALTEEALTAGGKPLLRPTELGLKMLRLMPAHAEAVWHGSYYDGGMFDLVIWENSTWEAMKELAAEATNMVDLAIAHRWWRGSETDGAEKDWAGYWALPEVLADRLVTQVLALAGIPPEACTAQAYIDKHWGEREPTPAETRAALARLAAEQPSLA